VRKVGIVGTQIYEEELKERAQGYELWSINNCWSQWPDTEFSRWYEIHTIKRVGRDEYTRRDFPYYPISRDQTVKEYLIGLDSLGIPVYMQQRWPRIVRQSVVFPFNEITARFGSYFGCSFAWMVAHALMEGVDEIGFFGIAFGDVEYWYQRPSTERMIGIAEGMGKTIYIDGQTCDILRAPYIYGTGENFDLTYLLHGRFARECAVAIWTGISERLAEAVQFPEGRGRE
jgi:hypothetical protein